MSARVAIHNNEICVFDPSGKPPSHHFKLFIFGMHAFHLYVTLSSERQCFNFYRFAVIAGQKSRFSEEKVYIVMH